MPATASAPYVDPTLGIDPMHSPLIESIVRRTKPDPLFRTMLSTRKAAVPSDAEAGGRAASVDEKRPDRPQRDALYEDPGEHADPAFGQERQSEIRLRGLGPTNGIHRMSRCDLASPLNGAGL
jgi:hypothetical protein